jgi:hypothetical protein
LHFLRPDLWLVAGFVGLFCVALAIFWPAVHGPFVFDDFPNLQNLTHVDGKLDLPHIGEYLAAFHGNPGRPLSALSFLIEDSAWPTSPLAFKRDNLLLHLLVGVLVFVLARRLARQLESTRPKSDAIGLATAAMWLLHPIQLSATMLVVQRMNILCSIFVLLGLLAYLACVTKKAWPDAVRVLLAGAVLGLSAVLAILCKENGILVFAYAVALNLTLLRPPITALRPTWRRLLHLGTALPMISLAAVALVQLPQIQGSYRGRSFTLGERLLTQPRVIVDYLREILLPRIGSQGIFHDGYVASTGLLSPPSTVLSIAAVALVALAAWRLRARRPLFAFAVCWFIAGHLLESTVVPLELYFEHRNYLPMIGPLFSIACGIATVNVAYRRVAWALLGIWLTMVSALTFINARTWGDRGLMATIWVQENPTSTRAVQMLASYQFDVGDFAGARKTMQEGLARIPQADELSLQSVLLDCFTVGVTRSEWRDTIQRVSHMRYTAIVPELASKFGEEQRKNRCHGTLQDGDFIQLAEAMIRNPNVSWRSDAMSYIYYEMFRQAAHERNLQKVMDYLDASYAYRPDPLVPRNQAIYLLMAGLPDDAMRYLAKSEAAPQPWIKHRMFDIKALNAPLWQDARELEDYLRRYPDKRVKPALPAKGHSHADAQPLRRD